MTTTTATPDPRRRRSLSGANERFNRHHDFVSSRRQRRIADLALVMNGAIAVLYVLAVDHWDWHLNVTPAAETATIAFWTLSLLGMLVASSAPSFFNDLDEHGNRSVEPAWLHSARKYVFYPAAYANFVAAAIWIEVSGGLIDSPFTPVLLAMILTAQQLSRFRLNSLLFMAFGAVAVGVLAIYETVAGIHDAPTAPAGLAFAILVAAFLVTALCAHSLKQRNCRAMSAYPDPSELEAYRDPAGRWRYAMYARRTPLDPVLPGTFATAEEACNAIHDLVRTLCGTADVKVVWDGDRPDDEPAGRVVWPKLTGGR